MLCSAMDADRRADVRAVEPKEDDRCDFGRKMRSFAEVLAPHASSHTVVRRPTYSS